MNLRCSMSEKSNVLLRPSFKVLRVLLGVYIIPGMVPETVAEATTNSKDKITLHAIVFIKSLETFNASNESLKSSAEDLASSTKTLLEATGTATEQDYSSTLLKYVKRRPESFPELGHHVHGGDTGQKADATIDLLVHRADGEFFAFNSRLSWGHEIAYVQLGSLAQENGTELFYRGFSRPVTRTVIVGVQFTGPKAMKFSYFVDPKGFSSKLTVVEL
ncbi:unnamed protein product [Bemisia tabaci]|uniref:Uncharacterized protein n=1 Tax=Bemisia tabaci TaxID=7038 RepID=A0A9P0AGT1_BEMTA|nr:unnamed protein product [Bemisia tabaci]